MLISEELVRLSRLLDISIKFVIFTNKYNSSQASNKEDEVWSSHCTQNNRFFDYWFSDIKERN